MNSSNEEEFITLAQVKKPVKELIKRGESDGETSHCIEDNLHQEVLRAVAAGSPDSRKMAKEALKTLEISFCRYYA